MQIPIKIGYYAIGEKIGEGNYAEVKLATHTILNTQVNKYLSRASINYLCHDHAIVLKFV